MISGFQGQSSTKWSEPGRCSAMVFGGYRGIDRSLVVQIASSQIRDAVAVDSWTLSPDVGSAYNARPTGERFC
jgi:hypothetical protein